jgi:hypothetical protein
MANGQTIGKLALAAATHTTKLPSVVRVIHRDDPPGRVEGISPGTRPSVQDNGPTRGDWRAAECPGPTHQADALPPGRSSRFRAPRRDRIHPSTILSCRASGKNFKEGILGRRRNTPSSCRGHLARVSFLLLRDASPHAETGVCSVNTCQIRLVGQVQTAGFGGIICPLGSSFRKPLSQDESVTFRIQPDRPCGLSANSRLCRVQDGNNREFGQKYA